MPDWNTLKHDDLIGIEKAQLTLSDVAVNREGDYISKLFFININDKVETVIFTIYQKKVTDDGKILEATLYFNKLDGQFLDGYKIENGLLTKRLVVKKRPNVQKAAMFLLLQVKQEEVDWNCLIGVDGGELNEISLTLSGGGSSGSNYQSPDRSTGGISAATSGNTNTNNSGPGGGGSYVNVTSLAGTLYTQASIVKTLAEGEEFEINFDGTDKVDPKEELKCFDISNNAKLTIYVQQPRENTADIIGPNSVGHAFIGLEQNGIIRNIGFYPIEDANRGLVAVGRTYDSEIRTNNNYMYHVSISKEISSSQLSNIIEYIKNDPNKYNVNIYACTDFVIKVGNLGGFNLPSTTVSNFTFSGRSPGQLGQEIRERISKDGITVLKIKANSPNKSGNCN